MAIIVEDGTGLTNSQCYCSVAYLDAYLLERGITLTETEAEKEAAIVIAAKDWIDGTHTFAGDPVNEDQAMAFPRDEFDGVPKQIVQANAQAAHLQIQGLLLVDQSAISTSGTIESESKSVGPLSKSTTYKSGSAQIYGRILPASLGNLIKPFLLAPGGLGSVYRR